MTVAEIGALIKAVPDQASFKAAEGQMKGLNTSLGALAKRALKITAMAALPAKALTKGFQRITAIDDAKAKLQGLGYVGKEFTTIMAAAKDSVTDTAFGMDEAASSAANLMSSGMKLSELSSVMKQVANTAALGNVGMIEAADIFQDAYAVGKVTNDTLDRLALKGVPILKAFEKQLGKTQAEIKDMAKNGEISFNDLIDVMNSSDFKNAATEMGDLTLSGTLRNLSSDIGKVGAAFLGLDMDTNEIKENGIFGFLKETVPEVRGFVKSFIGPASELGSVIGEGIVNNLKWLKKELTDLHADEIMKNVKTMISDGGMVRERIKDIINYMKWLWNIVKPFAELSMDVLVVVVNFINGLIEKLGGLERILKWLTPVAAALFTLFIVDGAKTAFATWILKLVGTFRKLTSVLTLANLKTAALIALFALIAFAIEDIYGFLHGKDSITGDLLERFGIDPDEAKEKINTFIEKVEEISTKVKDTFDTVSDVLADFFLFLEQHFDASYQMLQGWLGMFIAVGTGIKDVFNDIKTGNLGNVDNSLAKMNIGVGLSGNVIAEGAQKNKDALKNFVDSVKNDMSKTKDTVNTEMSQTSGAISKSFDDMKGVVDNQNSNINSSVQSSLNRMNSIYSAGLGNATSTTQSKMSTISNTMKSPSTQSYQWGSDLASGLARGIANGTNPVLGAATTLANGIRKLLHFSEPDEGPLADFHTWMPDFMRGLATDLKNNKGAVVKQAEDLANSMAKAMSGANVSAKTIATSTTNNVSKSVNQNVNISNSYSGAAPEAVKKVSKGMSKSATDATTQMARALAYSR